MRYTDRFTQLERLASRALGVLHGNAAQTAAA